MHQKSIGSKFMTELNQLHMKKRDFVYWNCCWCNEMHLYRPWWGKNRALSKGWHYSNEKKNVYCSETTTGLAVSLPIKTHTIINNVCSIHTYVWIVFMYRSNAFTFTFTHIHAYTHRQKESDAYAYIHKSKQRRHTHKCAMELMHS